MDSDAVLEFVLGGIRDIMLCKDLGNDVLVLNISDHFSGIDSPNVRAVFFVYGGVSVMLFFVFVYCGEFVVVWDIKDLSVRNTVRFSFGCPDFDFDGLVGCLVEVTELLVGVVRGGVSLVVVDSASFPGVMCVGCSDEVGGRIRGVFDGL